MDDTTQLEDVTFEFTTLKNQNISERLLTNIRYHGKKLKNKAKDGVILKQYAVRVG